MTSKSDAPLVSCIVPVYNADKYLRQGIDSLLGQSYSHVEVILVDDLSTDHSWKICQEYAQKDSRVRIFQNAKNSGGPLRGRVRGIDESRGEWLTFMDGDDYVGRDYVKNLLGATHSGKYDIGVTGYSRVLANGRIEPFLWKDYTQTTDERIRTFYKHYLNGDYWTDPMDTVGQSVVRASVAKRANVGRYPDRSYAEDTLMALAFITSSTNGVNFVDSHDFYWRQVEGSGSHGGFSDTADKDAFNEACRALFHEPEMYARVMVENPLISVIVAAYNVERYIKECINSLTRQTYTHSEIIVIDDGSSDTTASILDKIARTDKRIRVVSQENQGLNMARAAGVAAATGEYIMFMDGDDVAHVDYVRTLHECIIMTGTDIAVGGFFEFEAGADLEKTLDVNVHPAVVKDRVGRVAYYLGQIHGSSLIHPVTAWGKMYRSSVVKRTDWQSSNYRRHEDNLEQIQWMDGAGRGIAVLPLALYGYRKNAASITSVREDNVAPDGRRLNYFEFLKELYDKTKEYLNDDVFEVMLLKNYSLINDLQLNNFSLKGQLSESDAEYARRNNSYIVDEFTRILARKNDDLVLKIQEIDSFKRSLSWKLTRSLRKTKSLVAKVYSRSDRAQL